MPRDRFPGCSIKYCRRYMKTDNRLALHRSPVSTAARCSNSVTSDAAGRSARQAPRIFAFAAMYRSKVRPIVPGTPALPTDLAHARVSPAARRSGKRPRRSPGAVAGLVVAAQIMATLVLPGRARQCRGNHRKTHQRRNDQNFHFVLPEKYWDGRTASGGVAAEVNHLQRVVQPDEV